MTDEYDLLIDDPTDFLLHYYLPRVAGGLSGFAKLASPLDMVEIVGGPPWMMRWADPDVQASLEKLTAAGRECQAWGRDIPTARSSGGRGLPGPVRAACRWRRSISSATRCAAPSGMMMDMFRQPDSAAGGLRPARPAAWSSGSPAARPRSRRRWCSSRFTKARTAS